MTRSYLYGLFALFLFTALVGLSNGIDQLELADNIDIFEEEYIEEENEEEGIEEGGAVASPPPRPATPTISITTPTASSSKELFDVVRVIDGDTIVIDYHGRSESVRMIGIDTPETVHPSKPVQCFGDEGSQQTKEWLEGQRVRLEVDPTEGERDKYYRLLGYVYRADGLFINLELIRQGYAYEYTYRQPYLYQAQFQAAEAEAVAAKRGLWAAGVCG